MQLQEKQPSDVEVGRDSRGPEAEARARLEAHAPLSLRASVTGALLQPEGSFPGLFLTRERFSPSLLNNGHIDRQLFLTPFPTGFKKNESEQKAKRKER